MNLPGVEFLDVPRVILEPMIGVSGRPAVGSKLLLVVLLIMLALFVWAQGEKYYPNEWE